MNNPRLQLKNVGQIEDADIEFGDLTVLVGPQATGKSIFLQFLRLLLDTGYVIDEMGTHGLVWNKEMSMRRGVRSTLFTDIIERVGRF